MRLEFVLTMLNLRLDYYSLLSLCRYFVTTILALEFLLPTLAEYLRPVAWFMTWFMTWFMKWFMTWFMAEYPRPVTWFIAVS